MSETKALIDWGHLEKYVVGDVALRDEILSIFVEQANKLMAEFDASQTDEGWKMTAHSLKGASRGVGAWDIGELCEEAETMIGGVPGKCESRSALYGGDASEIERNHSGSQTTARMRLTRGARR